MIYMNHGDTEEIYVKIYVKNLNLRAFTQWITPKRLNYLSPQRLPFRHAPLFLQDLYLNTN